MSCDRGRDLNKPQWNFGVDGLSHQIEALRAGVRLPEVPQT